MLADALEHLIRGIVAHPDDVTVKDKELRRGRMLEVRVNPDDVGKVIGRSGRTATALRTVIGALAGEPGRTRRFRRCRPGRSPRLRWPSPLTSATAHEVGGASD